MRSLITGGAGFIGSHLADALLGRGDEVLVVDDLSSGRRENLERAVAQGAELVEATIADADLLVRLAERFEPERVFHLAAQIDVRRAVTEPAYDAAINVVGTINMLEAARLCGAGSFVFASTGGAIYGEGKGRDLPLSEDAATEPEAGYGVSKLAAETYVALYDRLYGLAGASLRFANVYGPRQDPHGEAGVVAIFAGLLHGEEPLTVIGDGHQTRDYVYVGDVIAALIAAGESLRGEVGLDRALNVGTGVETSVMDLVGVLAEAADVRPDVRHLPARSGEVQRISIDPGLASETLGWSPAVNLREGLHLTYEALTQDRVGAGLGGPAPVGD